MTTAVHEELSKAHALIKRQTEELYQQMDYISILNGQIAQARNVARWDLFGTVESPLWNLNAKPRVRWDHRLWPVLPLFSCLAGSGALIGYAIKWLWLG